MRRSHSGPTISLPAAPICEADFVPRDLPVARRRRPAQRSRRARRRAVRGDDWVAEEVPVALEYNGISHAVMLATPLDLEDFALGFSLSRRIVDSPAELYDVEREDGALGITLHLEIAAAAFARLKERRRSMVGPHRLRPVRHREPGPGEPRAAAIGRWRRAGRRGHRPRPGRAAEALQVLQRATGAVHAAAWCTREGELRLLREDVGRHNALDKLVGALAMSRDIDASTGFIVVTSRASFEMVQKTVSAGVPLLAAVSAPTALAIDVAEKSRLTLVGFARGSDLVVYSRPERLALDRRRPPA